MKIFVLTGKADKRILLYPLMHLCKYVGKTCVITDDPAIKRLYGGYSDSGDIDDVDIEFVASNNENAKERMGAVIDLVSNGNTYDFVIVSTVGYIAKNSVKTIALNTQSYSFLGWHVEEYKEKNPDIILSSISMYNRTKDTEGIVNNFYWDASHFQYLCHIEESKQLAGIKDKKINEFLKKEFVGLLEIPSATFDKLSVKQGGE